MLQVFHLDVAKVDLNVVMLHVFYTHVASILFECCIFFIEIFIMFNIIQHENRCCGELFSSSLMDR